MSQEEVDQAKKLLDAFGEESRNEVYRWLATTGVLHPFEQKLNVNALVILEALARAPDLTIRGIRGVIAEAVFVLQVVPNFSGWREIVAHASPGCDALLEDKRGDPVSVQVKMQRKEDQRVKVLFALLASFSIASFHARDEQAKSLPLQKFHTPRRTLVS